MAIDSPASARAHALVHDDDAAIFDGLVTAVLGRFWRQNARSDFDLGAAQGLARRLRALVAERGLPPRLAPHEPGEPRDWPAAEVAPLVARVLGPELVHDGLSATAARQLVKACFQPEFRKCRDSYRARDDGGACRRQQLARVRERISGSHCVDCPYWTALAPGPHENFLRRAWTGDPAEFTAHRGEFLPEDFRALRRFLRAQAP